MTTLYTVSDERNTGMLVERILDVCFPEASSFLDATYGNGNFWTLLRSDRCVIGMDRNPSRACHVVGDFTAIPFADRSFDVVVFDPPYHTDMGRKKPSVMGSRFGSYQSIAHLRSAVADGLNECWRVAKIGVLVKVQDYVHASEVQWMDYWIYEQLGEPYDRIVQSRRHKIIDPKWGPQLSAYRNHAIYLAYRKDGRKHIRRKRAS